MSQWRRGMYRNKMSRSVWCKGRGVVLLTVVVIHIIAVVMLICKNAAQTLAKIKKHMVKDKKWKQILMSVYM